VTQQQHSAITLPISGHTVHIQRQRAEVMTRLRFAAEQEMADKKPKPPTQSVVVADGSTTELENTADEGYIAAFEQWQSDVQTLAATKITKFMATIGITDSPPSDIGETMAQYKALGLEVEENPKEFWVLNIVAPSNDDLAKLMFEIFGRSMPQEAQVTFYRQLFQGRVPGIVDMDAPTTQGEG
jgi:hypothetical protein